MGRRSQEPGREAIIAEHENSGVAGLAEPVDCCAKFRRGMLAINQALLNQTSVYRAMFRNGLCWIDFAWGDICTVKPSGKTNGAMAAYPRGRASSRMA
jgi:hypothetical protein